MCHLLKSTWLRYWYGIGLVIYTWRARVVAKHHCVVALGMLGYLGSGPPGIPVSRL